MIVRKERDLPVGRIRYRSPTPWSAVVEEEEEEEEEEEQEEEEEEEEDEPPEDQEFDVANSKRDDP